MSKAGGEHGDSGEGAGHVNWLRLGLMFVGIVVFSIGLAYLFQRVLVAGNLPIYHLAWLAYLIVFGVSIVANLSVVVPVPFAVSLMIVASTQWDPLIITFIGSVGGSIGELSGYFAGYLGKRIAIPESVGLYKRIERWVLRYGFWAVFLLSLQPIIPFDVGGFVAGTARMPMRKFFPALWLGKFPKYLILVYGGLGIISCLPPFLR